MGNLKPDEMIHDVHTFSVAISTEEVVVEEIVLDCGGTLGQPSPQQQQQQSLEATNHHPGCEDKSWVQMVSSVQSLNMWREIVAQLKSGVVAWQRHKGAAWHHVGKL